MKGKLVVVTGATSGIGKEIARGLAKKGATVILGVRDEAKARGVRDEIAKDVGNENVSVMLLDVAQQSSIRDFAKAFRAKHDRLDVLFNNAGAWFSHRRESPDGIELTWATNVIGPYLLVKELEQPLRKAAPSRVVNMASSLATDYDPNDVEFRRRKYDGFKVYGQSKLAVRMLTWWQAKRFEGTGITVNAVAPGFVRTDFLQNAEGFMATMIKLSAPLFAVTPEKGAETPIWVATAPELENATSRYYDAMKEKESKFRDGLDELARICERMTSKTEAA
ncbi:Putative oxidoreductase [Minicystis rosea]|nr:Putative oxidoreductase [Minicystis rosea]